MALRAVPDHPKFSQLKARLRQPKGAVLGWLESIWHFAGRFTPQGNIGKYTDEAIEAWVEWDGKPGDLVAGLIECGWLDADPAHRILVHDWHEHADKATKNALKRSKLDFCTPGVRTPYPKVQVCDENAAESGTVSPLPGPEPGPVPEPEPGAGAVADAPLSPPPPHDFDADPAENIPDGLSPVQYAVFVLQEVGVAASHALKVKTGDALELLARDEGCGLAVATRRMLDRMRDAARASPPPKWFFWLEDGCWKAPATAGVSTEGWE